MNENGSITRLIVAAPWAVDRRAKAIPPVIERRLFEDVVRRLTELGAGPLGRFHGLVAESMDDGDPLLGPATSLEWPHAVHRHAKSQEA